MVGNRTSYAFGKASTRLKCRTHGSDATCTIPFFHLHNNGAENCESSFATACKLGVCPNPNLRLYQDYAKGSCILRMLIAELTDCAALWLLAAQLPMRFSKKKSPFYGGHSIARCYAVAIADYQPTWAASQNRII